MIEDKTEYKQMVELENKIESLCDASGADVVFSEIGTLPIKMDVQLRAYGQEEYTEAVNEDGEKVLVLVPEELQPGVLGLTYETGRIRIQTSNFKTDAASIKKLIRLFQQHSILMMATVYAQYAEEERHGLHH